MNIIKTVITTSVLALSTSVNASSLQPRLGGLAFYDDVAKLTWLADANYAKTSGYDVDGRMTWYEANIWVARLNIGGVDGWRLPDTLQPDASCDRQNGDVYYGLNCTGSEMGNLFYNTLDNTAGFLINTAPFRNVQPFDYWSATEFAPDTSIAWDFIMGEGDQSGYGKSTNRFYAWAVQSGDVSAVPVPTSVWLFGSGLIGLAGLTKRKKV